MKTFQTVIDSRKVQLAKYGTDQEAKGKEIISLTEEAKDGLIQDMTMPDGLYGKLKEYAELEPAIELGHPYYKNVKMTKAQILKEKQKLWEQLAPTKTVPLTADDVIVANRLVDALKLRMMKQKQNYNIQISDAKRDILLYGLCKNVEDKPELQPEGYKEYVDFLLSEPEPKKKVKLPEFEPEVGMTLDKVEKLCLEKTGKVDWSIIGEALKFYGLKPGSGMKLVKTA